MGPTTLISIYELKNHLDDPDWVILDCRFSLADAGLGRRDYLQAHIPGALYIHLDEDLSGPVVKGKTGRHPLPTVEEAARTFGRLGIGLDVQVVVYDDAGGALAAARAWWMLRWLGHDSVAVLDGGWQNWVSAGFPTHSGQESCSPRKFTPYPRYDLLVSNAQVDAMRLDPAYRVYDARAFERYHGQNETIDPVAGHIPGALSAPYFDNLTSEGVFRSQDELRTHYLGLMGGLPAEQIIFYCGSGVTSILNILAMLHTGLGEARLYAGSWSDWITDSSRPVAL